MKKITLIIVFLCISCLCIFSPQKTCYANNYDYKIALSANNKSFYIDLKKYEYQTNNFAILSASRKFFKQKTTQEKIVRIEELYKNGLKIEDAFNSLFINLDSQINKIINEIEKPYKNAKIYLKNNKFNFTKEQSGIRVDKEQIYKELLNCSLNQNNSGKIQTYQTHGNLNLEMVKKAVYKRAEFSTNYSFSSPERKHNIEKALKCFNEIVIYPNECLSFNKTTGKRTKEKGYQQAKIIVDGDYIEGVGGGVCQVSTTLYNACLLAGLDVVSSNGHSLPAHYVQNGLDAMVNMGSSDLIIKNNTNLPITLKTFSNGFDCKISVYGKNLNGIKYLLDSEKIENLPQKQTTFVLSDKLSGEIVREGFNGFITQSYRYKIENGNIVNKEKIRKTKYPSVSKTISL